MTTPDPREVERMLSASDPALVRLLAQYVDGVTNPEPKPPPKPTPRRTTSKPTAKPKPPNRKAPMRTVKKKKPPPTPKRRGVEIRVAEVPEHPTTFVEQERMRRLMQPPRLATDAHDVDGPTPCAVCGGEVEPTVADYSGPWRRDAACSRIVSRSASRVPVVAREFGMGEVDEATASLVSYRVGLFHETHPEPTYLPGERKREPWRHVDRKALVRAIAEAQTEAEEATIARPGEAGRCCWCGCTESVAWNDYGHKWSDGTTAGLCDTCSPVFERYWPSAQFWNDQRAAVAEALTGVPVMLGEEPPPGLSAYAEGDSEGTGEPWSHLPREAVEQYRLTRWAKFGARYAPADRRAEALAHARQIEVERAAGIAAREAEADAYGFTRGT